MKQFTFSLLLLMLVLSVHASQPRKVLIIGIDGTRSDALQQANTPNIDNLLLNGFYTFNAYHCGITVSGPSWSDVLCGVWEAKHGVTSNSYTGSNYNQFPYFITRAKEIKPNLRCVQVTEWAPMSDNVYNDGWDQKIKVPDGAGTPTAQAALTQLADPNLDALFVYFDAVDLAGHASGFSPNNPTYMAAIEGVDTHVGTVLNALYARPDYANEDWLILMTTDHGGIGTGHGGGTLLERQIWWIASGPAVQPQQLVGQDPGSYQYNGLPYFVPSVDTTILKMTPVQTDIAVTALHHLIFDTGIHPEDRPDWNLDGKSWLNQIMSTPATTKDEFKLIPYPNPATDLVTVWFSNPTDEKVTCRLTDMSGKTVHSKKVLVASQKLTLDIEHLRSGSYYLTVQSGKRTYSSTIIKN